MTFDKVIRGGNVVTPSGSFTGDIGRFTTWLVSADRSAAM